MEGVEERAGWGGRLANNLVLAEAQGRPQLSTCSDGEPKAEAVLGAMTVDRLCVVTWQVSSRCWLKC